MPRGGGRKVTQICSRMYAFSSLTRLLYLWLRFSCRNEKKSNPSFFSCFRARVYIGGVDLFFLRDDRPSLFLCPAEHSRGRSGFPKRALFVRERERDKRMMWFPISPWREKREREDQRLISPNTKRSARKERKKKTNRQPKHNISKKERERAEEKEREKESVFLREKRDIFPPFSLSFLCLPRREERVEKQTDIFRITAWHWPHLSLSLLLLHATMK